MQEAQTEFGERHSPRKRKIRKGRGGREGDGVKMRWIDIERREMRILRSSWMEDGKLAVSYTHLTLPTKA